MFTFLKYMKSLIVIISVVICMIGCRTKKDLPNRLVGNSIIYIQSSSNGQGYSNIKGVLKDSITRETIPFANIALQGNDSNNFFVTTDVNGMFIINKIPKGKYKFIAGYLGYDKLDTTINIDDFTNYYIEVKLSGHPVKLEKPVIYLYPQQKQEINISLDYKGQLSHTYPTIKENGWKIIAEPNGTLWDENGQEYYALFWEGIPNKQIIPKDGFIVSGNNTAKFLEEKLSYLGLNRREANEFILYWLPRMESNPYNLIHFSGNEYEDLVKLNIAPKPETIIRVMMITQPLQTKINFPLQDLKSLKKIRKGYTIVEWGGGVINQIKEGI